MAGARNSTAREVIQDWADGEGGYTFERGRMEAAIRDLCFNNPVKLERPKSKDKGAAGADPDKPAAKPNKQDVDFIVKELAMPKATAEQALRANDGDMTKALIQLMTPT